MSFLSQKPMKKSIAIFIVLFLLPAQALALQGNVASRINMVKNEVKCLTDLTITADTASEITVAHGLSLILDSGDYVLWDRRSSVDAQGSAVTQGKIAASVVPVYSADYKSVNIPVLANLVAGETFTLSNGLCLRAYDRGTGVRPIGLDVNGDLVADFYALNSYTVDGTLDKSDLTPPYPPSQFKNTYDSATNKVHLTWVSPPDYDFLSIYLERTLVRGGKTATATLLDGVVATQYDDADVQAGDKLNYKLYGIDRTNTGEAVNLSVDISSASTPTPTPTSPTPPTLPHTQTETQTQTDTELAQLTKLFSYYKVRQSIKCKLGVPVSDSSCLWARIDVIYAQTLLGRSDVNISLSARDLELMAQRIVWPEKRYQTECVEATIKAKSCTSLEKSLKRAHYFID